MSRSSGAITRLGLVGESALEFENGRLVHWASENKSTQQKLDSIIGNLSPEKRVLSMITVGLNPLITYGYAQDRFVAGSIGISGFGFTGIVKNATLKIGSTSVVEKGKTSFYQVYFRLNVTFRAGLRKNV